MNGKMFFFGVLYTARGHHLYFLEGGRLHSCYTEHYRLIPFRWEILDGSLLPHGVQEYQGVIHRSIINDWTILTMWDRTGDPRGNSNAAFIVEGEHATHSMIAHCQLNFPELWKRINPICK